ncbi:MAG TPA: hypothetical protein PLV92_30805 [Pirellulaceae bacterium]|nr:hypothetical protein [Pirellulaceae bacterium]
MNRCALALLILAFVLFVVWLFAAGGAARHRPPLDRLLLAAAPASIFYETREAGDQTGSFLHFAE